MADTVNDWEAYERRCFALEHACKVYQGTGMGSYEDKHVAITAMAIEFEKYLNGDVK